MSLPDQTSEDALRDLAHFLGAIEGYLDRVVLCGGWAPYFYRHLPHLAVPAHSPLLTLDFDFVVPPKLPREEAGTLHEQLLNGDFVAMRNREPPVVYYQHERWGADDLAPIYGELLTPLAGSEMDRSGAEKGLRHIQEGVVAQQLRYLELLLHEPLAVKAGQVSGLELPEELEIRIPNPAAYILQKALALKRRKREKQPKDLAYVFEAATLWFYEAERVREMVRSIATHSHDWCKWVERGGRILQGEFASGRAEGVVSAEQVFGATPEGHLVTAATVAGVTGPFLKAVFAGL